LSAAPREGWQSPAASAREAAAVGIASLIVALFVYDLFRRPERLEREVESRARRLVETNRKLMDEMTGRERAEEQAKYEATHDRLTGLPNRLHFLNRMTRLMERKKADPDFCWSLHLLNLDRFKSINDSLGPPAGDRILVETARRLELLLRPDDMIARVGADEFAVALCGSVNVLDVTHVAQRLQESVQRVFEVDGEEAFTTASIGVALSTTAYSHPEEPLRDAQLAMNAAKREGGGRHVMFDRAMHERAMLLSRMERDLRTAIERNELRAFYQPIVSLETGAVSGFEALVRWQHPERGFISPGAFLPIAESTGQVLSIDRWVLLEACRHVRALNNGGAPFSISVNLSGKQFSDPGLVDVVQGALQRSGLNPKQLRLEITESVMMENAEFAYKTLKELKQLDVDISLDDFGTGYSSLSYIREFPIDILKIDRSFVSKMTENTKDEEIVRMIVVLAETLGLQVVAEGVETREHLSHLRALRCAYGQGYLFSKPVDAETLGHFLAGNPHW
jgi:diguanylate cyclase (GGDEF)-like protein